MRFVISLAMVLLCASTALAQNPCSAAAPPLVLNANNYAFTLPEFDVREADGSFRISEFFFAAYAENADPNASGTVPVQGPSTVPRNAFTLVTGTTDCYRANMPALIPTTQRLKAGLRSHRVASATVTDAVSPWAVSENSFSFAPSVLAAPGRGIVSR